MNWIRAVVSGGGVQHNEIMICDLDQTRLADMRTGSTLSGTSQPASHIQKSPNDMKMYTTKIRGKTCVKSV